MIEHVTYGGTDLSELCIVAGVERTFPSVEASTTDVSGRDGVVLTGVRLKPPEVKVTLVLKDMDRRTMRGAVRMLSTVLMNKEPQRLEVESDGGLWCTAIVSGRPDLRELVNSGSVTVTFLVTETAMRGRHVSIQTSGTKTFRIDGTYPTKLRVSGTVTPSSGQFGVRLDGQDFMRVEMSGRAAVVMDSETRTCTVAGVTKQLTLQSDWLEPDTGEHTLTFDAGSGTITVEWDERWL